MEYKNINISINGLSVAVKKWHNDKLPKIIALNGWLDNAASFDLIAPYLKNYCLYCIDLPGHGLSSPIALNSFYHFIDAMTLTIELIEKLTASPPLMLGHSLGACIISMVAASIPSKVEKIALIEGLGPLTQEDDQSLINYQNYLRSYRKIKNKQKRIYESLEKAIEARAQNSYLNYEYAAILAQRGTMAINSGYLWRHDDKLLLPSPLKFNRHSAPNL